MTPPKPLPELVAELRELLAKATKGPLAFVPHPLEMSNYLIGEMLEDDPEFMSIWQELQSGDLESTATLVVTAYNALPQLLDAVESLSGMNDDLREAAKDCTHDDHQPFCRHYKGLKRERDSLTAENVTLRVLLSEARGQYGDLCDRVQQALLGAIKESDS